MTVFGLDLKSGGSLRQAFSDTLKESAMYKNVVKESITFMIKLTAWTLMNWYLYQGAIFTSSALQRSFSKNFGRSFKSSDMEHMKNILKVVNDNSADKLTSFFLFRTKEWTVPRLSMQVLILFWTILKKQQNPKKVLARGDNL